MVIPLYIPIGAQHHAHVCDTVWKIIPCAHCNERYAFRLNLQASASVHDLFFSDSEGAAKHAQEKAQENLAAMAKNIVVAVPCPHCGSYQPDMVQKLKDERSINPLQVAGAVITLLSFTFLAFNIQYDWLFTTTGAILGLIILALGYRRAFAFDPNRGDPEPRKALARKLAITGPQLDQLLTHDSPTHPLPNLN